MPYFDHHTSSEPLFHTKAQKESSHLWHALTSPYPMAESSLLSLQKDLETISSLLKSKEGDQLFFLPSREEAINQAVYSAFWGRARDTGRNHFLGFEGDDAASLYTLSSLHNEGGVSHFLGRENGGVITETALLEKITPRTLFLSLPLVCGLTGITQNPQSLTPLLQKRDILLHIDASYALQSISFDPHLWGADYVTFTTSFANGPKLGAFLWVKKGAPLVPYVHGMLDIYTGRYRSFDVPLFKEAFFAVKKAQENILDHNLEISRLRRFFQNHLKERTKCSFPLEKAITAPHVIVAAFDGFFNELLYYHLIHQGVYPSIGGGHCQHLTRLLELCGVLKEEASSSLSFVINETNTEEEILQTVETLSKILSHLSPLKPLPCGEVC